MPESTQFQSTDTNDLSATIAVGQTESNVIDLGGVDPCGFYLPANFDGTTLGLLAAPSPTGPFVRVQSGGSDYSLTTAASKYCPVENLAVVAGLRFVKLVAGTAQATTDTVITISARPV